METSAVYRQLSERTDHSVMIGVTGPIRTGKSTFVKNFMEKLVIPHIEDPYWKQRATDELPQSGSGRTIMTTEPKFVPEEAVQISPDGTAQLSIRLIDSVGYMVEGAAGAEEDGKARMVTTPWFDHEIPMEQAAQVGTKKVMEDHSTIGIVVTTDGTVTDLPRSAYAPAEARAIEDMKATGKPFLILVNSAAPTSPEAQKLAEALQEAYGVPARAADCQTMGTEELQELLEVLLAEFPVKELQFYMPGWVMALDGEHPLKTALYEALRKSALEIGKISQAQPAMSRLLEGEALSGCRITKADLGTGVVSCLLEFPEELFYEVLSQSTGLEISDDGTLLRLLEELAKVKTEYEKVSAALEQVRQTGYGIVAPESNEIRLEQPEIIRKGGNYAIKLKASAPSIHMIRADIQTEVSPIVGDEKQSRELADYLLEEYKSDTDKLWESRIFGKSLYDVVSEGLGSKIQGLPEESRFKFRDSLTKIVNEGANGLICIIL